MSLRLLCSSYPVRVPVSGFSRLLRSSYYLLILCPAGSYWSPGPLFLLALLVSWSYLFPSYWYYIQIISPSWSSLLSPKYGFLLTYLFFLILVGLTIFPPSSNWCLLVLSFCMSLLAFPVLSGLLDSLSVKGKGLRERMQVFILLMDRKSCIWLTGRNGFMLDFVLFAGRTCLHSCLLRFISSLVSLAGWLGSNEADCISGMKRWLGKPEPVRVVYHLPPLLHRLSTAAFYAMLTTAISPVDGISPWS